MDETFCALGEFIRLHDEFTVISHLRPDGDAYGSTLGLGLSLRAAGKKVHFVNEDGLLHRFKFLPGSADLVRTPEVKPTGAIIALDCAAFSRLGDRFLAWNVKPDVNIDHHVSNPGYASINIIESDAPATAQVLFEIISSLNLPCPADVASNLFMGLSSDTGSFRYRGTTGRTFEVASALVRFGANPSTLARDYSQNFSLGRFLLLREVMASTQLASRDRIAWYTLTPEVFAKTGALPEDTDGLIEELQSIGTVEVAFAIEVAASGEVRCSLRSRGTVDVQEICSKFGGGGHTLAAGLRMKRPLAEVEALLLGEIEAALEKK